MGVGNFWLYCIYCGFACASFFFILKEMGSLTCELQASVALYAMNAMEL
jgi:hypothetical protein